MFSKIHYVIARLGLTIYLLFGCMGTLFSACGSNPDGSSNPVQNSITSKGDSNADHRKGVPWPDPIPHVVDIRIQLAGVISGPLMIIGLPGAVADVGIVTVELRNYQATTYSTAEGSFVANLPEGKAGEKITIRYRDSNPAYYLIPYKSKEVSYPQPIDDVPPIIPWSEDNVLVQGQSFGNPGDSILGINVDTGDVIVTSLQEDLAFQFVIPAYSGNTILVYDDESSSRLGTAWELMAP